MSPVRAAWRIVLGVCHVLVGLRTIATQFNRVDDNARQALVQTWSVQLLCLLGVELHKQGSVSHHTRV